MTKRAKRGTCKHCGERIRFDGAFWRTAKGDDDAGYFDGHGGDASCRQRGTSTGKYLPHELWSAVEMRQHRDYRRRETAARQRAVLGETDDVRFFIEHAGYAWEKGKETRVQAIRRCALDLAHAETEAERRGWRVAWEPDEHMHDPDCCDATEAEQAVLYDADGKTVLASLGSVCGANANGYRRVVEAELADEALANVRGVEAAAELERLHFAL